MKKALITGINGQDGSYMAELLLLPLSFDWIVASSKVIYNENQI